jgi:ribosomal protein S18 acetylase RimI-like enzyme
MSVKYIIKCLKLKRIEIYYLPVYGKLGAFAIISRGINFSKSRYTLEYLGVSPECQKNGYGTVLLRDILNNEEYKNSLALECIPDLIGWYSKFGFKISGEKEKYGDKYYYSMTN